MTDTHTHPYYSENGDAPDDAVRRAIEAGVTMMVMANVDLGSIKPMRELAARFPKSLRMAMGLHPSEVDHSWREKTTVMEECLERDGDYIAVGEIGIDLHWETKHKRQQTEAFDHQLGTAEALGLPVVIHTRDALEETLEILGGHPGARGVMHSWTGDAADVEKVRRVLGDRFFFGINGIVTYKNNAVAGALHEIGLEWLVLETDAPWLAPVPLRGKTNESAYIYHTGAKVAEVLGISPEELESKTDANARRLFPGLDIDRAKP